MTVIAYTLAVDGRLGCGRAWSSVDETGLRDYVRQSQVETERFQHSSVHRSVFVVPLFISLQVWRLDLGLISLWICLRLTFIDSV